MTEPGFRGANALIFDPFAGMSGDMLLGALVDLGLPEQWLSELVASLGVGAEVVVERATRSGIACGRVRFVLPTEEAHRHLEDILAILEGLDLPEPVIERSSAVFRRLAVAEAAVHGTTVERVHFHEVGALDAILDVVCAVAGLEELSYRHFFTRPVAVGRGTIEIDHGRYPLPAPATARLLEGLPVTETDYPEECTTPTGAALLAELTGGKRAPGAVVYGRSAYGAGTRDPEGRPNCLRVIECEVEPVAGAGGDGPGGPEGVVHVVHADIDDLSPEYVASAREALMEAGAVDVTLARLEMKKGRPGVRVEVLTPAAALEEVVRVLFRATTTIGVRHWPVERITLERAEEVVEWRGHPIRAKVVRLPGGGVRRKLEFEDVAAAARATGLTPHEVRLEVDAAGRGATRDDRKERNEP